MADLMSTVVWRDENSGRHEATVVMWDEDLGVVFVDSVFGFNSKVIGVESLDFEYCDGDRVRTLNFIKLTYLS